MSTLRGIRCFTTACFHLLPRSSPRVSRPPASIVGKLYNDPEFESESDAIEQAAPQNKPPSNNDDDGKTHLWTPPTLLRKRALRSSLQSPRKHEPILDTSKARHERKPQKEEKEDLFAPKVYRDKYSLRWETEPPTPEQLAMTDRFFLQYPPKFLWSAAKFKHIEFGDVPEVAFLGRSNVGKSSLLNALLKTTSARTSSKPGHTRLMNAFSISQHRLVLLDMPGYGHASRPEWGVQIMKYLSSRKQFRRAFLLIDASHGPKETDMQMLDMLGASGIPYQVVLSKVDKLEKTPGQLEEMFDRIKELLTDRSERMGTSALGEVVGTSADPAKKGQQKLGIEELRWAVMVAAGLDGTVYIEQKIKK